MRSTEDPIPQSSSSVKSESGFFSRNFQSAQVHPNDWRDRREIEDKFEIIRNDEDSTEIRLRYIAAGERAFANLEDEFPADVSGVTFRRLAKKPWEPDFVSVIDSRGDRSFRANHTKWHELGHLLVMTDQLRIAFRRTFCKQDFKDPEESLVDVLAGHFEYWPAFFVGRMTGRVSFCKMEEVRAQICPEASKASSILGLVKAWPTPCILIEAGLDYKQKDKNLQHQGAMPFRDPPKKDLRVTSVLVNDPARLLGMRLHRKWRVPRESALYRTFEGGEPIVEIENLNWWTTSAGSRLPDFQVFVETRKASEMLQALITPEKL